MIRILYNDDGSADVTNTSAFTGQVHTMWMPMTREQFEGWYNNNVPIQIALPHLTRAEREFLMTGTTQEEWDRMLERDDE